MTVRETTSFAADILVILLLGVVYVSGLLAKTTLAYAGWAWSEVRTSIGGEPIEHAHGR